MKDQKHSEKEEEAANAITALRECPAEQPDTKQSQSGRLVMEYSGESPNPECLVTADGAHPLYPYVSDKIVPSHFRGSKKPVSMRRPASTDKEYGELHLSSASGCTQRLKTSSMGSSSTSDSPQSSGINADKIVNRELESSSMSEDGYAGGKSSASFSGSDDGVSNRDQIAQSPSGEKKRIFDINSSNSSSNSPSSDSKSENLGEINKAVPHRVKEYVSNSGKDSINLERVGIRRSLRLSTSSKESATCEERVESGTENAAESAVEIDHRSLTFASHEDAEDAEEDKVVAKSRSGISRRRVKAKRGIQNSNILSGKKKVCYDEEVGELRPAPYFYYVDHSQEADDDPLTPFTPPARVPIFPAKMHALLMRDDLKDIIRWMPHGRSFKVLNQREFELHIIPTYFEHGKFSSFVRQAQGWGFRRFTKGPERHAFYNDYFLRGLPHLCKKMARPSMAKKMNTNPDHEPNLFDISIEHPVPEKVPPDNLNSTILEAVGRCILTYGPKARLPVVLCRHDNITPKFSSTSSVVTGNLKPSAQSLSKKAKAQTLIDAISTVSNGHSSVTTNLQTNPSNSLASNHQENCKKEDLANNATHQPLLPSASPRNVFPNQFILQPLAQQERQQLQVNQQHHNQTPEALFQALMCSQPLQNQNHHNLQSNQRMQQDSHQNHSILSSIIAGNSLVTLVDQERSRMVPNWSSNIVPDALFQQQLQQQEGLLASSRWGTPLLSREDLARISGSLVAAQTRSGYLGPSVPGNNDQFQQRTIPNALAEQHGILVYQPSATSYDSFSTLRPRSHDTLHSIILEAVRIGVQLGVETAARVSNASGNRSPDDGNGDFDTEGGNSQMED